MSINELSNDDEVLTFVNIFKFWEYKIDRHCVSRLYFEK